MSPPALTLRIIGTHLPGSICGPHQNVRVGLQVNKAIVELVDGSAAQAVWETDVSARRAGDGVHALRGPAIHGRADERFLYLAWVATGADGRDEMFRRAKLQLDSVPASLVEEALRRVRPLVAELALTDACGMPLCASVRPPLIRWFVPESAA